MYMTDEQMQSHRKARLAKWIDERCGGSQAALLKKINENLKDDESPMGSSELSTLLKDRAFGEKKARKLERQASMPRLWLDQEEDGKHGSAGNVKLASIGSRSVPVISYVQAGNFREAIDAYPDGGGFDYIMADQNLGDYAFALEIEGLSMLPRFNPGDRVIIDPDIHPSPGDFVVAKNKESGTTFKKYRPRGVGENGEMIFELVPLNEDFETMRSDRQPIQIIGTMVEHRQYRRR